MKKKDNKKELNCIGYPHDDPYGLVAAWWTIFTKPKEEKKESTKKQIKEKHSSKDFY
jgi:hypothetical protein